MNHDNRPALLYLALNALKAKGYQHSLRSIDIGSGQGRFTQLLVQNGFEVDAVDLLDTSCSALPGVAFQQMDVRHLALQLDAYHLVSCLNLLQFLNLDDRDRLIARIWSSLAAGGVFVGECFTDRDPAFSRQSERLSGISAVSSYSGGAFGRQLTALGGRVLFEEESEFDEDHPPIGPHRHSVVTIIAQK